MSEQDTPVENGSNDATDNEKIDGIIEQVRGDVTIGDPQDPREILAQRLADAGLVVSEAEFERLAAKLT